MIGRFSWAVAAVLTLLVARAAGAHEYWLEPTPPGALPGDTVTIGARVGEGFCGERKAFSPSRAVRWRLRTGREADLTPVSADGDSVWARVVVADHGGLMFGYESDFARITLEPSVFERYLRDEGLEGPRALRRARGDQGPGRERYRRCAKAYVAGADPQRALEPFGMPCEIVPLSLPGEGPRLRVRVVFEGRPLRGARLNAWRRPFARRGQRVPVAWSGRADARGEITVPVSAAGEWLLGVVHMVASRDRDAADWESSWASLTFARRRDAQDRQ